MLELLLLIVAIVGVVYDYLIYKYVRMEYNASKEGNVLLKKLLSSRKRSTAKALIKEVLNQGEVR